MPHGGVLVRTLFWASLAIFLLCPHMVGGVRDPLGSLPWKHRFHSHGLNPHDLVTTPPQCQGPTT